MGNQYNDKSLDKSILMKCQTFINGQDYTRIEYLINDGEIPNLSEFLRMAVKNELIRLFQFRELVKKDSL